MKTICSKFLNKGELKSIMIFLIMFSFNTSYAETIDGSGNWSDSGNWQGGNIGGDGAIDHDVVMERNLNITIQSGESYTIETYDIERDCLITVDFGGTLVITGDLTIARDFTMVINGDLTVEGNLDIARTLDLTVGTNGNMNVLGNVSLERNATLDVQGDLDVDGDFTSERDATINVGSSGTIDVGMDFNLGDGSTVTGTGGVAAGSCSGDACDDSQLPITLSSFLASSLDRSISLKWTTESEENFSYFDIEKSTDGVSFTSIGAVDGNGNSKVRIEYNFEDNAPLYGVSYYRLTAVDIDGTFEIFDAISVNHAPDQLKVNVYPNPTSGNVLKINFGLPSEAQRRVISIFDMYGAKVFEVELSENNSTIQPHLAEGLYIAKIQLDNYVITKRIVVN